jgi:hypothetical protein
LALAFQTILTFVVADSAGLALQPRDQVATSPLGPHPQQRSSPKSQFTGPYPVPFLPFSLIHFLSPSGISHMQRTLRYLGRKGGLSSS